MNFTKFDMPKAVDSFDSLVLKAKNLGFEMAQKGFTVTTNPYDAVNRRLAREWLSGHHSFHLICTLDKLIGKEASAST